jgi:HD superfamily phosphohydrolase
MVYYYFAQWQDEEDRILSDLCDRFMNRRLFKYVEIDPSKEELLYQKLQEKFKKANIDPTYYLVIDSSEDLPYDVYRAGEGRVPIYLQMPSGAEKELSTHSVIVESITGKKRLDHKLYYPAEFIDQIADKKLKGEILELLQMTYV